MRYVHQLRYENGQVSLLRWRLNGKAFGGAWGTLAGHMAARARRCVRIGVPLPEVADQGAEVAAFCPRPFCFAGCPNRCRHCWLGSHPNGNIETDEFAAIIEGFRNWRGTDGEAIAELGAFSWWREPDFRGDYRELWEMEQSLSSEGCAKRFELLSTWRLARDESYARWAAQVGTTACQISFFGMEENTDWAMRRVGAFRDQLMATERCLDAGIAPRWQLFVTKRCLGELDAFFHLMDDLKLRERCGQIGKEFVMFIGGISPEGSGYNIGDVRLEEEDLKLIPQELIRLSRDGISALGQSERSLMPELLRCAGAPNMGAAFPSIAVDANFDVYPNNAEPAPWWRLGNLKTDGVDAIMRAYSQQTPAGMRMNRTVPIAQLAKKYGDENGKKLYARDDLICRFAHQWGVDFARA